MDSDPLNPKGPVLIPDAQINEAIQEEEEYGGFGDELAAGALSAARTLSFGTSDVALTKSGLVDKDVINKLALYNPDATTTGAVLTTAAPLLLSGGTSGLLQAAGKTFLGKATKTVGAGIIGASKLGQATQAALEAKLLAGAGESLVKQVVAKAAAATAGAAVEGGVYGTGQLVSELALSDDPTITAEKIMGTVGLNMIVGGGLGGGISTVTHAGPSIVRLASDLTTKAKDSVMKAVNIAAQKGASGFASAASKVSGQDEELIKTFIKDPAARAKANISSAEWDGIATDLAGDLKAQYEQTQKASYALSNEVKFAGQKKALNDVTDEQIQKVFGDVPKYKGEVLSARKVFKDKAEQEARKSLIGVNVDRTQLAPSVQTLMEMSEQEVSPAARRYINDALKVASNIEKRSLGSWVSAPEVFAASQAIKEIQNAVRSSKVVGKGKLKVLEGLQYAHRSMDEILEASSSSFTKTNQAMKAMNNIERQLSYYGIKAGEADLGKLMAHAEKAGDPAVRKAAEAWADYIEMIGVKKPSVRKVVNEIALKNMDAPIGQMETVEQSVFEMQKIANSVVDEIKSDKLLYNQTFARKIEIAKAHFDEAIENASTPFQFNRAVDQFKRAVSNTAEMASTAAKKTSAPDVVSANEKIQQLKGILTSHLEDTSVYGNAAKIQSSVNEKVSRFLTAKKRMEPFFSIKRAGFKDREIDFVKVRQYLNGQGQPKYKKATELLNEYLEASDDLFKTMDSIGDEVPAAQDAIRNNPALKNRVAYTDRIKGLKEKASWATKLKGMGAKSQRFGSYGDMLESLGVGAGMFWALGPAGVGLYMGYRALKNPENIIKGLSVLERMQKSFDLKMDKAVNSLLDKKAGIVNLSKGTQKFAVPVSLSILNSTSFTKRVGKDRDDKIAQYEDRMNELSELQNDPEVAMKKLGDNLSALSSIAPQTSEALQVSAHQAIDYLYQKAPKAPEMDSMMKRKYIPSDMELARWQRSVAAVLNPLELLNEIQRGDINPETVEAVQVVYPQVYQEIQSKILQKISEQEDEIPYRQRLIISQAFGIPVESSMKNVQMYQNSWAPAQEQPQSGSKPVDMSGATQTNVEKVTGR